MFTKRPDRDASHLDSGKPMAGLRPAAPSQLSSNRAAPASRASGAASVIGADLAITGNLESKGEVHIAFTADDRRTVDEFYAAATAAGGRDNGKPGLRPHYHPNYYGAFVFDPDGNNIEAVCHAPA